MLINDIVKQINKLLSNSSSFLLTYERLEQYINVAVDHINFELKTNMKTPQEEWEEKEWIYTISNHPDYLGSYYTPPKLTADQVGKIYYDLSYCTYYYFNSVQWCPINLENGTYFYDGNEINLNIEQIDIDVADMAYMSMPDNVIRSVLIYYAAASYLEEEDEFEAQHSAYKQKADENLQKIRQTNYSMYICNW